MPGRWLLRSGRLTAASDCRLAVAVSASASSQRRRRQRRRERGAGIPKSE